MRFRSAPILVAAIAVGAAFLAAALLDSVSLLDGAAAAVWVAVAAALGFAVFVGGRPSLAQGAFVGVGAYSAALLRTRWGVDPLAAIALIAVLGVIPSFLVGLACARLRSAFAVVSTWLLAWAFVVALKEFPGLTGGSRGIVLPLATVDAAALGRVFVLGPPFWWFTALGFATLAIALLATARQRYGASLAFVRADAPAAAAAGLPVARLRTGALAASGWVAIVGGAVLVQLDGIADPTRFGLDRSYLLLLAVLVGGAAPLAGPVLGLGVVEGANRVAEWALPSGSSEYSTVLVAGVLLALVVARPGGVVAWSNVPRRARRRVDRPRSDPSTRRSIAVTRGAHLAVSDLRVILGDTTMLEGVELSVRPGECLLVLGPNGSGKTTLARALAGTLPASSGALILDGHAVEETGPSGRRRMGIARMLQRPFAAPRLTTRTVMFAAAEATRRTGALQALTLTPLARAEQREVSARVDTVLAWAGLDACADEPLDRLDPTQHRLLQLGSTVVGDTRLVILDEPTAGLDADVAEGIVDRIRWLRDAGLAVIVIEHDLDAVGQIADRWVLMCEGRLVAVGAGDTFRTDPLVRDSYFGAV